MEETSLRVLIVEDSEQDAELIRLQFELQGLVCDGMRVETPEELRAALFKKDWQVLLSDFRMPAFTAINVVKIVRQSGLDVPIIIVSGAIGEEQAAEVMRLGARDFIRKDNLVRLVPVIRREIAEARLRHEHDQALRVLKESEARFRDLVQLSFDGVAIFSERGILEVNESLARIFGYRREDLLGRKFQEVIAPEFRKPVEAHARSRAAKPIEVSGLRKDGARIPVEILVRNTLFHGDFVFLAALRDISERKRMVEQLRESEARLRLLSETIPEILWMANAHGRVEYYNRRWTEYTGLSAQDHGGADWQGLLHPEDRSRVMEAWAKARSLGNALEFEARLRRRDGTYHWVLTRAQPFRDTDGRILNWFGATTDIQELRQAIHSRDEVLGIVSHDLRNPIGAVMTNAALLKRKPDSGPEAVLAGAERILRAATRANQLIEDLLDLARIEAGVFKTRSTESCGIELFRETVEMLKPLAQEKGIELEVSGPSGLSFSCDRDLLTRVLENLIGNAIKFTPENGRVRVQAEEQGDQLRFEVRDTGPGIPREQLAHVFDRFWQVKKSDQRGAGLGLAIAKGIVEAHGGTIFVESEFGHGSSFVVTIPRRARLERGREVA